MKHQSKKRVIFTNIGIWLLFLIFIGFLSLFVEHLAEQCDYSIADLVSDGVHNIIMLILVLIYLLLIRSDTQKEIKTHLPPQKHLSFRFIPILILLGLSYSMLSNSLLNMIHPLQNSLDRLGLTLSKGEFFSSFLTKMFSPINLSSTVLACIIVPMYEELFFRGILLNRFKRAFSFTMSAFMSSLLFGLFHIAPHLMVNAFITGMIFSWIYRKTGSLIAPVIVHGASNFMTDVMTNAYHHEALYYTPVTITATIVFIACLAALYLIFRKQEVPAHE